ncbi:DUF5132 domain-containing protein [Sandaracinus amylolyticus]|uniref:DUF5132 domain-containing protein n=1 Tax=Sandaracinus amylolyticus TaxID=927083 RepID=A0A0F6YNB8_9BACT|nr:DUF5132 domain-containing protein [Sandaracinus amylolyticus]AKF10222.1 hypothetical protein DB32_007371 [Sandaracinus amylolyticus]
MSKRDMWIGIAVGAGAVLAAPLVLPVAGAIARPLVRETIKLGFVVAELARERGAVALEALEDLIAEAREDARIAIEAREEPRGRGARRGGDGARQRGAEPS